MVQERLSLTVGKNRMMFSTGLSAISNTRYLQRVNTGQSATQTSARLFQPFTPEPHASAAHSALPKRVKEIRLDKIGFDVLADTHNVRYALCLKNWQLDEDENKQKKTNKNEAQDFVEAALMKCCKDFTLLFIAAE